MIDPKFTSPVSGFLYINEENEIPISLSGDNISLSLCDRTGITNNLGNYFVSLNLPTEKDEFPTNSSLFFFYPELQQLNVDKILLIKIPNTAYTEYIDARSIKLNLPGTGNSQANFYTLFSSTYSDSIPDKYGERSPLLGDNITYLFSDSVNLPYTGSSVNQLGQIILNSATTSWNPLTRRYQDRPSATSYSETKLSNLTINTDRRLAMNKTVFTNGLSPDYRGIGQSFYGIFRSGFVIPGPAFVNAPGFIVDPRENFFKVDDYVSVERFEKNNSFSSYSGDSVRVRRIIKNQFNGTSFPNYPDPEYKGPWDVIVLNLSPIGLTPTPVNISGYLFESGGTYYNYDNPVGFAVLDKGLIAITHGDIVNSIDWASGFLPDGSPSDGTFGSGTTNIYFTNTDTSIYGDEEPVCSLEFTSLDTVFKIRTTCNSLLGQFYISNNPSWDIALANNPYAANQKVSITEVGLYNEMNELVAVAKFSEPVYKGALDLFTFEIDINI